jgi:uncharacterized membrane protein YeaQ/YmgE (transglycosylase-associated protein family)
MERIKPSKKKLIGRTIFMFLIMGALMQMAIRLVDPYNGIGLIAMPLAGCVGGFLANYFWEFIWFKITGKHEV